MGNFFQSLKGPPFNFFHILQPAGVSQSPKGPHFTFFDTVTLFNSFFFIFCHQLEFHKTQRVPPFTILSLRYSADFGRSRLVDICLYFRWKFKKQQKWFHTKAPGWCLMECLKYHSLAKCNLPPEFFAKFLARFLSRSSRFLDKSKTFQDLIKKIER